MRLQGKVLIENQGKTNSEKTGHLQDVCGSADYRNGFHTTNLYAKLNNTSETDTKNNTSLTRVLTR